MGGERKWVLRGHSAFPARSSPLHGGGGARAPPPAGRAASQSDLAAKLGKGRGPGGWVPAELPDRKCGGSLRNAYFLFRFSEKGRRNRMGTGLAAVWHRPGTFLKEVGAGSDCSDVQSLWGTSSALSSLPLPLGRVSNTNNSRHVPLSGQLRRDGSKREPPPPSTSSFSVCLFQILMDDETARIFHLLEKKKPWPPIPSNMHSWGQSWGLLGTIALGRSWHVQDGAGRMTQSGRRGPGLQVSALPASDHTALPPLHLAFPSCEPFGTVP
ncbi:uncharacterized protein LOC103794587 [Callithrix jacchus]